MSPLHQRPNRAHHKITPQKWYPSCQQTTENPSTRIPVTKVQTTLRFQCNVVYKIPCNDCPWNYIGETGRCFQTRKKEHQRNLKNYSNAWQNNHSIDFDNACVIDKGNYRVRKTLESWHRAKTVHAENNSKPLPRQYSILL